MDFKHLDGQRRSIALPRRSVAIMSGDSRYTWSHGITPRKTDILPNEDGALVLRQRGERVSLTFRKLSTATKSCRADAKLPSDEKEAEALEYRHVHEVYKAIAEHYSETRHTPWPFVADFVRGISRGSFLLDVGCANGKYFALNHNIFEMGVERSANLAAICRGRGHRVVVGDVLTLPIREGIVDTCICIAVIHHLSTTDRRRRAIAELARVTKVGGQILIQVWAMNQEYGEIKSKYLDKKVAIPDVIVVNHSRPVNDDDDPFGDGFPEENGPPDEFDDTGLASDGTLPVHVNRTPFKRQDMLVPWRLKSTKSSRNKTDDVKNDAVDESVRSNFAGEVNQGSICTDVTRIGDTVSAATTSSESSHSVLKKNVDAESRAAAIDSSNNSKNVIAERDNLANVRNAASSAKVDSVSIANTRISDLNIRISDSNIRISDTHSRISDTNTKVVDLKSSVPDSKNSSVDRNDTRTHSEIGRAKVEVADMNRSTYHRFYHLFRRRELELLCAQVEGLSVEKVFYDNGNWCVLCRKSASHSDSPVAVGV